MSEDFIYEEQKQLIKMWKSKYYEQKDEIERLENIIKESKEFIEQFNKTIRKNSKLGEYAEFMTIPQELLEMLDKGE